MNREEFVNHALSLHNTIVNHDQHCANTEGTSDTYAKRKIQTMISVQISTPNQQIWMSRYLGVTNCLLGCRHASGETDTRICCGDEAGSRALGDISLLVTADSYI